MGVQRSYKDLESKGLRIGCLNVRGCNRVGVMEDVGSIFEERNLDILSLSETKLNWTGGRWFGNVWGRSSGSTCRTNSREGVAILLKKDLWHLVEEWAMISSRIMWLKLRIRKERWVFVCAHAPDEEVSYSVNKYFWDSLNLCLMGFHPYDKIILMGDLNAKVGDTVIDGIVGFHGVPGKDYNGEKLIELCKWRGFLIGNTVFKKNLNRKYTWQSHYTDKKGNHTRALIDYICISQRAKARLSDVYAIIGGAKGMSDHSLVVGKLKVLLNYIEIKKERERKERKVV